MSSLLTNYKVFIASPGGLEPERKLFKEILLSQNENDAIQRGCYFQPVGWEITLGGLGRPQEKINDDLRTCDLFVLILWDRWGSPTGANDGYTSGTHEEYCIALDCIKNEHSAMSDIVVFFKAVEPRRLSDPGPQLSAVLDFKKTLEKERSLLFETFDTPDAFGDKLRRHVAKWTRDHCGDTSNENNENLKENEVQSYDKSDVLFIDEIKSRVGDTDAEKELANDILIKRDMHSFDRYGLFLMKAERFEDALSIYKQMHDVASSIGDLSWASTAIARIGGVYRSQGRHAQALSTLMNALRLKQEIGDKKGQASVHIWIGDLTKQKDPETALEHYNSALSIDTSNDDIREADLKWKMAKCYAEKGSIDVAKSMAEQAFDIYKKNKNKRGMHSIKQWRRARLATIKK